jgi:hypothetical protein
MLTAICLATQERYDFGGLREDLIHDFNLLFSFVEVGLIDAYKSTQTKSRFICKLQAAERKVRLSLIVTT